MFGSRLTNSIFALSLVIVLIIGGIAFLMTYLSFLSSTARWGNGEESHAKTEAAVEITRREFQTPDRPNTNLGPVNRFSVPFNGT